MRVLRDDESVDAEELDLEGIKSLGDPTRMKIMQMLAENPSYPAEISSRLDIGKQQAYYHFKKLQEAELVEKTGEEKKSGGVASFYSPSSNAYVLDLGTGGEKTFVPERSENLLNFFSPLIDEGKAGGSIVVGSPDQHGEDQVRARDGHLAAEIGMKIGSYADTHNLDVMLDTEIVSQKSFERNLIILGGVLTNTIAKEFNEEFPASFPVGEFPYHGLSTPESSYSEESVGLIAKAENPEAEGKYIYLVAGIGNRGTRAAVIAFRQIEELVEGYESGEFYTVVKGLDVDGDGRIDDYEVIEK